MVQSSHELACPWYDQIAIDTKQLSCRWQASSKRFCKVRFQSIKKPPQCEIEYYKRNTILICLHRNVFIHTINNWINTRVRNCKNKQSSLYFWIYIFSRFPKIRGGNNVKCMYIYFYKYCMNIGECCPEQYIILHGLANAIWNTARTLLMQ